MKPRSLVTASSKLSVSRAIALLMQAGHFALAARFLPRPEFAGFAAAIALVTIGTALAEFGLTHTTVLALNRRDRDEASMLRAAVLANLLLIPLVLVVLLPVALIVLSASGLLAFLVLLPWFAVSSLQLPFVAYRRYQLRFRRLITGEVLGRGLPLLAMVPVLVMGQGWSPTAQLVAIGATLLAGSLVGLAVFVATPLPRLRRESVAEARRLLATAAPLGLTSGLSMIHVRVDQLVLSAFSLRAGLAAYAVAYRVLDAALVLVGGAGAAAFPMLAQAEGAERASLARTQAAFLAAGALVMGFGAFVLAPQLTALIGGGRYPEAAWLVRLLAPALVLSTLNAGAVQVAVVEGKARALLKVAAWGTAGNLVLNLVLDRTYGARAAALATVATELMGFVLVARIARRALPGSQPWAVPAWAGGAFLAATFGAHLAWNDVAPFVGIAMASVALPTGLVALWTCGRGRRSPAPRTAPVKVFQVITKLTLGGAQETALRYTLIDRQEYETVLVTGPDGDGPINLHAHARAMGVRVVTVPQLHRPVRPWADAAAVVALARMFRREGATIVHTHSSKAGLVGRAAARLAGVPTVLHTVHGWSFHDGMPKLVRRVIVHTERLAARWTTRLVVVGEADRQAGLAAGIGRPEQYVLIRSAIELDGEDAAHSPADVRAELGIPASAPIVGSVTRLYRQKDPETFLRVAAAVAARRPDARIVLVGDGPLRPQVERLAQELGLDGRLLLLGWRKDVRSVLGAFDVFVSTARWEGLPRTIVEAAAAYVPIVASDVGSTSEVVIDGESGYLAPPGDVERLTTTALALLDDPGRAAHMAASAARRIESFGVDTMLRELAATYESLLPPRTPEPRPASSPLRAASAVA